MGNTNNNKDPYFMNIKIIGSKMKQFYEKVQDTQKSIKDLWNFEPLKENESTTLQINNYFEKLNKNLEDDSNINQNIREVLILKIRSVYDSEVNLLIDLMNKLEEVQYMPLVLLLHTDNHEQKLTIDTNEYKQIDQRLIFIHKFSEDSETIEKEIDPLLLRFCSIHNDLGDRFVIGNQEKNNENNFDLVDKYFPFNINIACIGRFRQGKSTGVNMILKEYKAKESSKGCSQTKNLSFYQVRGKPIRILDIPGFEDDYTVYEAVKKFEECGKLINRLKEQIHIILYFMNCLEEGTFMNFEYKMIKEMIKHKKSKIIYVITHSPSNLSENEKKKKIRNINLGLRKIIDKYKIEDNNMLKAVENNVVFVNFHKNHLYNVEPFGTKELFQKIYEFFIKSEDYINSFINIDSNSIEEKAIQLRRQAQDVLLSNKISGGLIGAVPIADLIVQNFFIKKNAIKKVGEIFGFNIDSIEEKEKNELEENLSTESIENKIGNGIKTTSGTGSYIGGGVSIGNGVVKAAESSKMLGEATKLSLQATNLGSESIRMGKEAVEIGVQASKMGEEATKLSQMAGNISVPWYMRIFGLGSDMTTQAANLTTQASKMASESAKLNTVATNMGAKAASLASESSNLNTLASNMANKADIICTQANNFKLAGTCLTVGSLVLGVSLGAYFTHKYCEDLLDRFVDIYKKYPQRICNSYKDAAYYFYYNGNNN